LIAGEEGFSLGLVLRRVSLVWVEVEDFFYIEVAECSGSREFGEVVRTRCPLLVKSPAEVASGHTTRFGVVFNALCEDNGYFLNVLRVGIVKAY